MSKLIPTSYVATVLNGALLGFGFTVGYRLACWAIRLVF